MLTSLRGRLFLGLTVIIVLTGAIGGTFAYLWAYSEAIEMQDSSLVQIGSFALTASIRQSGPVNGVDADSEVAIVELGAAPHGSAEERQLWRLTDGLHNDRYQGQPVRILLRTRPDGSRFAVTQRTEIRTEIAGDMAVRTLLPIAALVPCLLLVTAWVIERSFRPMLRLADDLDTRKPDDVGLLAATGAPRELRPFLGSINGLLERVRAMMEQQRHFIADAAHELRTPITALSLQAENLESPDMPPAMHDRLEALRSGMRRTRNLLEQLLALARQDTAPPAAGEAVQLDIIAKGVVADLLPEAASREIDLGFTMVEPVAVNGDPLALMTVVRNLAENAVKFTPDGGSVDLGVYREDGMAVIRIEDTGPGIAPEDIDRICEPFFRGRQPSGDGAGLGLSIVKRIVDRGSGSIRFENMTGAGRSGLRVTVKLAVVGYEAARATS
ncbi:histidine kinase [Bradyrhizobium jicamae]|uniref:histidine kinase n=1 Tax=Bradyrhizobium jicamae TaxID=280332 RepID=A0ABS5FJT3_9BRAD|nr:ATP-binding protein [Bradyrhizobium jicamae]MBR0797013.1 histidine kinase [Bradyrhizobium jicamae]MBR0937115.1 histidine kinase [Bradyrhizobium jicamae]